MEKKLRAFAIFIVFLILSIGAHYTGKTTPASGATLNQVVESSLIFTPVASQYLPYLSEPALPTPTPTLVPLPSKIYSMMDATVIEAFPNDDFGDTIDMWTGYDAAGCHPGAPDFRAARSLVQFDLTAIPRYTQISQANLHLRMVSACWRSSETGSSRTITVYRSGGSWSESSVTWNTQPGLEGAYGSASKVLGSPLDWHVVDVTELIQAWTDGAFPNNGIILRSSESAGDNARFGFATSEWGGSSYDPYLTITYTGITGAPDAEPHEMVVFPAECDAREGGMILCYLQDNNTLNLVQNQH